MKQKKNYLFCLLLFLIINMSYFLYPKQDNSNYTEQKIEADIMFILGGNKENEDFFNPRDFAIDEEGKIYILDSGNSRIQVFSPKGEFLISFGHFGQGPGELSKRASRLKILEDGNLYLIDNYQHRITIFSKKGEYLKSFKIYSTYDDIVLKNKTYYLCNLILDKNHKPIHFSNDLNKISNSFGFLIEPTTGITKTILSLPPPHNYILKNEFTHINFSNIIINSNGDIIYSQNNPYHLTKYDKNGKKKDEIIGKVDFDTHFPLTIKIKSDSVSKHVDTPFSSIHETISMDNDKFIVPILGPDRSFIYLDLYDPDCNLITRYILQNIFFDYKKMAGITNIIIDRNDNIYCLVVSREDMPKFFKCKLMIN